MTSFYCGCSGPDGDAGGSLGLDIYCKLQLFSKLVDRGLLVSKLLTGLKNIFYWLFWSLLLDPAIKKWSERVKAILGLVAVLFSGLINPIVLSYSVPAILTLGIFFIISGGLAIAGAKTVNRRQVVATIVLALITTIIAGFLFLCVHEGEPVFSVLLIAMAEVMLITTIVLRPLSMYCSSNK